MCSPMEGLAQNKIASWWRETLNCYRRFRLASQSDIQELLESILKGQPFCCFFAAAW